MKAESESMDGLNNKNKRILERIFTRPIPCDIEFNEVVTLFEALGGRKLEKGKTSGSAVALVLPNNQFVAIHKPHHEKDVDRGAIKSIREFLEENGITP